MLWGGVVLWKQIVNLVLKEFKKKKIKNLDDTRPKNKSTNHDSDNHDNFGCKKA